MFPITNEKLRQKKNTCSSIIIRVFYSTASSRVFSCIFGERKKSRSISNSSIQSQKTILKQRVHITVLFFDYHQSRCISTSIPLSVSEKSICESTKVLKLNSQSINESFTRIFQFDKVRGKIAEA